MYSERIYKRKWRKSISESAKLIFYYYYYLDQGRYTWRHNSALCFIAQTLQFINSAKLYVDLSGYLSPCTITSDSLRPDIILSTAENVMYIIELTVGFETNLSNNVSRKELKYHPLLTDLAIDYKQKKLLTSPLAPWAYLEFTQIPFLNFAWKEALTMVI